MVMTAVDLAIAALGYTEQPPGSNHTRYGDRFWPGQPSPWCCELVTCCLVDSATPGAFLEASVGRFRNRCAAEHRLVDRAGAQAALDAGRIVAIGFEWEHDSWPDHIGFLLRFTDAEHAYTIEGNAPGPDHTDEVAFHTRPLSAVSFYAVFDPGAGGAPVAVIPTPAPPPAAVHPAYPVLPGWMVLCARPNGRPGFTNHGDQVAVYQARLRQRGWKIGVDGVFGPQTDQITRKFQADKRLAVDGEVGQNTWRAAWLAPIT